MNSLISRLACKNPKQGWTKLKENKGENNLGEMKKEAGELPSLSLSGVGLRLRSSFKVVLISKCFIEITELGDTITDSIKILFISGETFA